MMFLTRLGEDSRMVVTGRRHPDRPPALQAVRAPRGAPHPAGRARDRLPHVHRGGRRAPPARPAHHRGLRPLQEPDGRGREPAEAPDMSVRNQLRLLVGGLGAHRGDPKSAPALGVPGLPGPEPARGGPHLRRDGGGDRDRELGRDEGARPAGAAEPDRARADRRRLPVHLRERRADAGRARAAPEPACRPSTGSTRRRSSGSRARPATSSPSSPPSRPRTRTRRPSSSTGARRSAPSPTSSTRAGPTRRTRTTLPRSSPPATPPARAALFENGFAALRQIYSEGVHDDGRLRAAGPTPS